MRIRIGPVPDHTGFHPEQGDWRRLKEPAFDRLLLLALGASVLIAAGVWAVWVALIRLHGTGDHVQIVLSPKTLLVSIAALAALAVVHELVHAAVLPRCGWTSATTVGFWPQKLTPYVSYDGELSRNRHITVGLMPFLLLSAAPVLIGLLFAWTPSWVAFLSTVNAFISSGDLIGAVLLVVQTPRAAIVRSKGLETWWRSSA
ncbi:MAG: DUF3267 domain-containing protein [Anaerolineales bacterium]|nr:DUF3267 domain-containing protein [Anaerolineales bacterium]